MIHPAVENLINYVNDENKPYTNEKLRKLCSSMAKEDKEEWRNNQIEKICN